MITLAALGAALVLATTPIAQIWPFGYLALGGYNGASDQFVYVPAGQTYRRAVFEARVQPAEPTELTVQLDARTVFTKEMNRAEVVSVPLGDLGPGVHRLTLLAVARSLVWGPQGERRDPCFAATPAALTFAGARLAYDGVWTRGPWISELPDALYNRALPGTAPLVGDVLLTPVSDASAQAALRLTFLFTAARPVDWQVDGARSRLPADFQIVIRQEAALTDPAVIQVAPGRLAITYRDAAALAGAVNALLNMPLRRQLRVASAAVSGAAAPAWGAIVTPRTLSDLGIADRGLSGADSVDLALMFPSYWAPTGVVHGNLVFRSVQGLQNRGMVWASIDGALAGSVSLAGPPARDIRMQVDGDRLPQSPSVDLHLQTSLPMAADCRTRGVAWLDAHASTVDLPHRIKAGGGGLIPALAGHPTLTVQPSPEALEAALAIAQTVHAATGGKPVPFEARLGAAPTRGDAVFVGVDPADVGARIRAWRGSVYPDLFVHGTWLHAAKSGDLVLGTDPVALVWFSRHWRARAADVADGAEDVVISADGYVQNLSAQGVVSVAAGTRLRPYLRWVPEAAGAMALLLGVAWAGWVWRRGRG